MVLGMMEADSEGGTEQEPEAIQTEGWDDIRLILMSQGANV